MCQRSFTVFPLQIGQRIKGGDRRRRWCTFLACPVARSLSLTLSKAYPPAPFSRLFRRRTDDGHEKERAGKGRRRRKTGKSPSSSWRACLAHTRNGRKVPRIALSLSQLSAEPLFPLVLPSILLSLPPLLGSAYTVSFKQREIGPYFSISSV